MLCFEHVLLERDSNKEEYYCNIYNRDVQVGYCKYYKDYKDYNSVYISYIKIFEEYRRRGYATLMVNELQKKYTLLWEYSFTQIGRKWFNKLVQRGIVDVNNNEVYYL